MGLTVPNEAGKTLKLELEKLRGSREGWMAVGELKHAWEKGESSVHGGKAAVEEAGSSGPGGQLQTQQDSGIKLSRGHGIENLMAKRS